MCSVTVPQAIDRLLLTLGLLVRRVADGIPSLLADTRELPAAICSGEGRSDTRGQDETMPLSLQHASAGALPRQAIVHIPPAGHAHTVNSFNFAIEPGCAVTEHQTLQDRHGGQMARCSKYCSHTESGRAAQQLLLRCPLEKCAVPT